MKKSLLLLTVLFFSLVAFAQGFSYGVTAGLNVSQPKDYKNHLGFNVGVKGEYLFSDKIDCPYLETSLLFTCKGWKDDVFASEEENAGTVDWKCDAYYLELPVMVGYKFGVTDRVRMSASAGPYVACGLFGKSSVDGAHGVTDVDNIFSDGMYKRFDYGVKVYVGIDFSNWQLGLSYGHSLQNPVKTGWVLQEPKDRTLSVQVAYIINR